ADSVPDARSGFADTPPPPVPVLWDCESLVPDDVRLIIDQSLAQQPQPAYHDDSDREYATEIAGWRVKWAATTDGARVKSCERVA
ncbi:MAG TPA: tRNA (N6-threonylcarbamoyladenosine(37)-N6)-methyltransferase TrmO, partial [Verrucomicrobiales bacterium]|nr:tRNA (N6-threonylcarbamoyladenosine(37)-N6)-methyltransferase TrmO [Verrucomicrobiales bacterium]